MKEMVTEIFGGGQKRSIPETGVAWAGMKTKKCTERKLKVPEGVTGNSASM